MKRVGIGYSDIHLLQNSIFNVPVILCICLECCVSVHSSGFCLQEIT